jgi:hypothetical protein
MMGNNNNINNNNNNINNNNINKNNINNKPSHNSMIFTNNNTPSHPLNQSMVASFIFPNQQQSIPNSPINNNNININNNFHLNLNNNNNNNPNNNTNIVSHRNLPPTQSTIML